MQATKCVFVFNWLDLLEQGKGGHGVDTMSKANPPELEKIMDKK